MSWKLYNDDCLKIMTQLDDESIDLVITSPPYDHIRDYGKEKLILTGEKICFTLKEIQRILKPTGSAIFVIDDQVKNGTRSLTVHKLIISAIEEAGLYYHDMYIYLKDYIPGDASRRARNSFEYMPFFKKDRKKYKYYADRIKIPSANSSAGKSRRLKDGQLVSLMNYQHGHPTKDPGNALYFKAGSNMHENKIAFKHPATFPLEIPRFFIKLCTDPGDTVLDIFAGSGTTGVAAEELNRNSILIELNNEYCDIIRKRMQAIENRLF